MFHLLRKSLLLCMLLSSTCMAAMVRNSVIDPAVAVCNGRGETCASSTDCCAGGACRQGICRRQCAKRNEACATSFDCCGKKICSSTGVCVKPPKTTDGEAEQEQDPSPAPLVTSWPDAVGKTGEEATAMILETGPNLMVQVVLLGTPVTEDWREDRVRVFVDETNIVVEIPVIG